MTVKISSIVIIVYDQTTLIYSEFQPSALGKLIESDLNTSEQSQNVVYTQFNCWVQ